MVHWGDWRREQRLQLGLSDLKLPTKVGTLNERFFRRHTLASSIGLAQAKLPSFRLSEQVRGGGQKLEVGRDNLDGLSHI